MSNISAISNISMRWRWCALYTRLMAGVLYIFVPDSLKQHSMSRHAAALRQFLVVHFWFPLWYSSFIHSLVLETKWDTRAWHSSDTWHPFSSLPSEGEFCLIFYFVCSDRGKHIFLLSRTWAWWGTEDEDKQNKNTNTEQCVGHHGNNHKEHK
jgi:hypothetical protein